MKQNILSLVILTFVSIFSVSAQVFDYVVAKDGTGTHTTVQAAIDDCPDNVRKLIFIKNGTYEEKIMIGVQNRTVPKLITLIGESVENTVITWDDYNGKSIVYDGKTITSGTPQSATFTASSDDFYAENITIQNTYTQKQAVALYNGGDRQTFKNCRIIGYQDTHYPRKGKRSYYFNCYIEGATDYICGGGTCLFDSCTLKSIRNGSYITAPEDITAYTTVGDKRYYYGFMFRNCRLTSDAGVEVYLGRPWQATSSSVYLNCEMENIKVAGWSTWSGNNHLSSFFAEYKSVDFSGDLIDVSQRADWSYQLTPEEVQTYYTNDMFFSKQAGEYDAFKLVITPDAPLNLTLVDNSLTWELVENAKGYVVFKNGEVSEFTTEPNTVIIPADAQNAVYFVKAVGVNGNLSAPSNEVSSGTGIKGVNSDAETIYCESKTLFVPQNDKVEVFSLSGVILKISTNQTRIDLSNYNQGIYLVKVTFDNSVIFKKVLIK